MYLVEWLRSFVRRNCLVSARNVWILGDGVISEDLDFLKNSPTPPVTVDTITGLEYKNITTKQNNDTHSRFSLLFP